MDIFGAGGGEKLAEQAGLPFIGAIPMDPSVREGGDSGEPVVVSQRDSPVALALRAAAEDVAAKVSVAAIQQSNFIPINIID